MKMLLLITLSVLSFNLLADDAMKAENFSKLKEMMLSNIDKRISFIQDHKSCVAGAADKAALKGCHEKHRQAMKSLKTERKAMREQLKDERKSRKEEKKK